MSKRIPLIPIDGGSPLAHRPFAALGGTPETPMVPESPVAPAPVLAKQVPKEPFVAWAVVRLERKGRGGKEVTAIEKLELRSKELEAWAKLLKQHLGCGGTVEGRSIVLQGDQRERAAAWLEQRVKKVTRG